MSNAILNTPSSENSPTLLLYNFTAKELAQFQFSMKGFPGIRLVAVPENAYTVPVQQLLVEEMPSGLPGNTFLRHMLVLAYVPEPLVHLLLNICKQVTGEKVLKAMLTETNQHWTSEFLYENLLTEETRLGG